MTAVEPAPEQAERYDEMPAPTGWRAAGALALVAFAVGLTCLVDARVPLPVLALAVAGVLATCGYVAAGVFT